MPPMIDIAKARALCAAATPEPWAAEPMDDNGTNTVWYSKANSGVSIADAGTANDAAFIAAARTGWSEALDEIERLKSTIDCWAQIETERDTLKAEVELVRDLHKKAVDERARLRKALEWYANSDIYDTPSVGNSAFYEAEADAGKRARAALAAPQTGGDDE